MSLDLSKIEVILDAGHSSQTPGKCSPDKSLYEWKWNREVLELVKQRLDQLNIKYYVLHPENTTLNGSESKDLIVRANRANARYKENKAKGITTILISIHVNAAGNGTSWMKATGWSAWTSVGKTGGDKLADALYDAAEEYLNPLELRVRTDMSDKDRDYESNFYILKKTNCPACLVENFFMDSKTDIDFLKSDFGKGVCANIIAKGVLNYCSKL